MATYGHEVKDKSDKFIRLVEEATTLTVSHGPPGGVLVDFLPIRKSNFQTIIRPLFMI